MIDHNIRIQDLVEKFLDGRTTNIEERELYDWFRTHDVPEEWEHLKSMFAWYEAGMPEDSLEQEIVQKPLGASSKIISLRHWLQVAGGCAAIIAIVIFLFRALVDDDAALEQGFSANNIAEVTDGDDLMRRADILEQQAYELLAWADMNSL